MARRHWTAVALLFQAALVLGTVSVGALDRPLVAHANTVLPAGLSEFQPNVKRGGRAVSVDVDPFNANIAVAGTESGGLYLTADGGTNWSHLGALEPPGIQDVRFATGDPTGKTLIATTLVDTQLITPGGGIWVSKDRGNTWTEATLSGCPSVQNGQGVGMVPGSMDIYAGTDCGLAVSHDLGATWTIVFPYPTYAVVAESLSIPLDICASGPQGRGHYRSTSIPVSFTASSAGPDCQSIHSIAVSPFSTNTVFATSGGTVLESDNAGSTWTDLLAAPFNERPRWVRTRQTGLTTFDMYAPGERQSCTNALTGLKCTASGTAWVRVPANSLNHDLNDIAFSPGGNCPQFMAIDFGMVKADPIGATTCTDGSTWDIAGSEGHGFAALQVYDLAGQINLPVPGGSAGYTDLYFGTQDNHVWASPDGGVTWPQAWGSEGLYLQTPHTSVTGDLGLTFAECGPPCNDVRAPRSGTLNGAESGWPTHAPAGASGLDAPLLIEPNVYVQWSTPSSLYMTTDDDATAWTAVATLPSTVTGRFGWPQVSGTTVPTIYQAVDYTNGQRGLVRITGTRVNGKPAAGTVTQLPGNGLRFIDTYSRQWLMGRAAFAVDLGNPMHLIAADSGASQMVVSNDGGNNWTRDDQLTALVTDGGRLRFGDQVHQIAFDPTNSNIILVATEQSGVIASIDGGQTWGRMINSTKATGISDFFFDEQQGIVYVSSWGRGLWRLSLSRVPSSINYTGDVAADYNDTSHVSALLTNPATGAVIPDAKVSFSLGSQTCDGTTDLNGVASCEIKINQASGSTTVTATFAGDAQFAASSSSHSFTIRPEETAMALAGPSSADFHDTAAFTATLFEGDTGAAISGKQVTIAIGSQSCQGMTGPTGQVGCTLNLSQASGGYTAKASFDGDTYYAASSVTFPFTVTKEETTLTYTGPVLIPNGQTVALSATLLEDGMVPIQGRQVTFKLGTQTCGPASTNPSGVATCTLTAMQPLGPGSVSATFSGDAYYRPASDARATVVFAFLTRGIFVAGAGPGFGTGSAVVFWGSGWAKVNDFLDEGGNSFKGFAPSVSSAPPTCASTWTAHRGNSNGAPGMVPTYMAVAITADVLGRHGSLSGEIIEIVIVRTNSGYRPDPGHAGTGTVVAILCATP